MKTVIASIFLLLSAGAYAAEGTTFCPYAKSFKFNKSSNTWEAPGDWNITGDAKLKVKKFKYVQAWQDGGVYFCVYEGNSAMQIIASGKYGYVADDIDGATWRDVGGQKICASKLPTDCLFHFEG